MYVLILDVSFYWFRQPWIRKIGIPSGKWPVTSVDIFLECVLQQTDKMRRCWLLAEPSSSCTARQMPWVMLSVWRGGHRSVFETAERVLCFEGRTWRTLCKEESGHDSDRLREGMTRCLKVRIVIVWLCLVAGEHSHGFYMWYWILVERIQRFRNILEVFVDEARLD